LVEVAYPNAEYIRLVQDNLNTHTAGALYDAFPPPEARRLLERLEFHFTPKHGSWLNQAEIAIAIFERECLSRRVGDPATPSRRVAALEAERNAAQSTIRWRFTTQEARRKLQVLYPDLNTQQDRALGGYRKERVLTGATAHREAHIEAHIRPGRDDAVRGGRGNVAVVAQEGRGVIDYPTREPPVSCRWV